jgi:hypothetical protein
MQKHGAMHEPITSHTSNGVSITRERLLDSSPADAGRVTEAISGIKTNYHSCKGLRKRWHRFKTHGTVHGAVSGRIHKTRLKVAGGRTVITAAAGSLMRASINLVQKRANPALRAFSTAGATARLTKFTVAG